MKRDSATGIKLSKRFITWLSVGILAGSGVGLFKAFRGISAQQYFSYGMDNLAVLLLRSSLNKWIFVFFAISLIGIISSIALRMAGNWVQANIAVVKIVDHNRALASVLSVLLAVFFFFWFGSLMLLGRYPITHSTSGFVHSIYDYLASYFSVSLITKGLLITFISCLIIAGFGWIFTKIKVAELMHSVGNVLGSRWTAATAVFLLTLCGVVNVYAAYTIGRGGGHRFKNVIMISVDTLRADHMGCYGYARNTTPFMDSIARKGIFFENAFTPWPVTTPAVAAVFTSRYGHTNRVTRITPYQRLADNALLLSEILKNKGYSTEAVVSNTAIKNSHIDQGFDVFVDVAGEADAKAVNKEAFKAVDRLKQKQQDGKPFFLWVHYIDPHAPYKPPEFQNLFTHDRYYDSSKHFTFRESLVEEVKNYQDQDNISPYEKLRKTQLRSPMGSAPPNLVDKTTTEVGYHVAMYDSEIRFVDQQIELLMNKLEQQGLLKDSIIVFWADHGESLGEQNYYFAHGRFAYNACLKVPFIIVNPDYQACKIKTPVSTLDLTPTLLSFLRIKRPVHFEGTSLVPLVEGKRQEQRDIFAESGYAVDFQKTVIKGEWKLIYVPDDQDKSVMQGKMFELYNLSQDSDETRNLIDVKPEVANEMKKSLFVWIDSWKDSFKNSDQQGGQTEDYSKEALDKLRSLGYVK